MTHVHLGYAVGSGEPVAVPVQHLAVTGQTQASGKTTTLEALVTRSDRCAVAFVTKRAEASFAGQHNVIPPFFTERADWQFVSSVLEAALREKLKFERSWIMRACKGATTLSGVQKNVRRLMDRSKGLTADVYMALDHYLDIVIPQIDQLPYIEQLVLRPGLNVMDLSAYTTELQALVIRSVIELVYARRRHTLVIIPEAWEFVPQNRGSPVLLACENLIRKGGAAQNYVWLDSQDIAGVHKNILRSVGVWILGVQRETNEARRVLAHIPSKKPRLDDVMQLERGQFFACFGSTVVKVYVQPAWMPEGTARDIALGDTVLGPPKRKESIVNEQEANELRSENARLKGEVSRLQLELHELRDEMSRAIRHRGTVRPLPPDPTGPPAYEQVAADLADAHASHSRESLVKLWAALKQVALADNDAAIIALLKRVPEIEVTKRIERIKVDDRTQPGVLAAMVAEGFFNQSIRPSEIIAELKRRGRSVAPPNVSRDLGRLCQLGFLTREIDGGYLAVPGMKVHIVEQVAA